MGLKYRSASIATCIEFVGIALSPLVGLKCQFSDMAGSAFRVGIALSPLVGLKSGMYMIESAGYHGVGIALSPLVGLKWETNTPLPFRSMMSELP